MTINPFTSPTSAAPLKLLSCILQVKVKFSLEQAMKAQRGSRGIALLFL
jgi:hypothetical protein